ALQYARDPGAVPDLKRLAEHSAGAVRFGVADALSSSAPSFRDVGDTLIALSDDPDRDVRWSAVFELAAWLERPWERITDADADRVRRTLEHLARSDPDPEIRADAANAVARAEPGRSGDSHSAQGFLR